MKVKDLKECLSHLKDRNDNLEVVIPIEKKGVLLGVRPHVKVKVVGRGIDWDSSLFIIWPESTLVEKDCATVAKCMEDK